MRKRLFLGAALALLTAGLAGPAAATDNRANWHIHDGGSGAGHAPVGSFWWVLGYGSLTAYQTAAAADPGKAVTCPNATDKVLLGSSTPLNDSQVVRAGICRTEDVIIHMRSQDTSDPVPAGWSFMSTSGGISTYYKLTDV